MPMLPTYTALELPFPHFLPTLVACRQFEIPLTMEAYRLERCADVLGREEVFRWSAFVRYVGDKGP